MIGVGRTRPSSISKTIGAPVGGWNTSHALADMPENHAVILDNWFPETEQVKLRGGSLTYATGMASPVETLIEYAPNDGVNELFAASGANIYNVTATGAVGAAVVVNQSNARYQHTQIGTPGGQFVFMCNGADVPFTYDGTTAVASTATGPTMANVIWCATHQARLFFGTSSSLSFWYLGVRAIGGAATEFPLSGIFKRGGYIMSMGSWTRDGGSGPDDVAVFLTSEGEAAVYSGTDPDNASTWSLVGVFQIGRPIGRRCMIKSGGSLVMITEDGFVDAASILAVDRARSENVAISKQINDAVNSAVHDYGTLFGWQPILYSKGQMLIFNIPISTTEAHQYVFNSLTNAPCRFKDLNALCWGMRGDDIFFGTSAGTVIEFNGTDTGGTIFLSDDGSDIAGDAMAAFSYFGSKGMDKAFKLVEPIFKSTGNPNPALDLNVDFTTDAPSGQPSAFAGSTGQWGVALWGVATWGKAGQIYKGWLGVRGIGRAASLRIRVWTSVADPAWIATNYTFIRGGQL